MKCESLIHIIYNHTNIKVEFALQTALGIETAEPKETAREASEEELRHRYRLEAERDLYKECFEKLAGIV